jgi:hypothetical protein
MRLGREDLDGRPCCRPRSPVFSVCVVQVASAPLGSHFLRACGRTASRRLLRLVKACGCCLFCWPVAVRPRGLWPGPGLSRCFFCASRFNPGGVFLVGGSNPATVKSSLFLMEPPLQRDA